MRHPIPPRRESPRRATPFLIAPELTAPDPPATNAPVGITSVLGNVAAKLARRESPTDSAASPTDPASAETGQPTPPTPPAAPDLSRFRQDPADNPHGETRPAADPYRSRLLAGLQIAAAGVGALGAATGSGMVGAAGAGAAGGLAHARDREAAELRADQAGFDQWLQGVQRNNRDLDMQEVTTRFGLERDEYRDARQSEREEARFERQQTAQRETAEERRRQQEADQEQRRQEQRATALLDSGAWEAAAPALVEAGYTDDEARELVAARQRTRSLEEARMRRLASGGSRSPQEPREGVIDNLETVDREIAATTRQINDLRAQRGRISTGLVDNPEAARLDKQIQDLESQRNRLRTERRGYAGDARNNEFSAYRERQQERGWVPINGPLDEERPRGGPSAETYEPDPRVEVLPATRALGRQTPAGTGAAERVDPRVTSYVGPLRAQLESGTDPLQVIQQLDAALDAGELTTEQHLAIFEQLLR